MAERDPNFPELEQRAIPALADAAAVLTSLGSSAVGDVRVQVTAVLGRTQMSVQELLELQPGKVVPIEKRIGEAVEIQVNGRLVARGEVVLVDGHLGVTMTEMVKG